MYLISDKHKYIFLVVVVVVVVVGNLPVSSAKSSEGSSATLTL